MNNILVNSYKKIIKPCNNIEEKDACLLFILKELREIELFNIFSNALIISIILSKLLSSLSYLLRKVVYLLFIRVSVLISSYFEHCQVVLYCSVSWSRGSVIYIKI